MKGRILIAEDEDSVREFLTRGLGRAGYAVTSVGDGQQALEALARSADGGFDLLLTDIVMPRLDGIALALKVAKAYPQVKILMMTGYAAERQRAYGLDALSHEVISKPFTLKQMTDIVGRVLN